MPAKSSPPSKSEARFEQLVSELAGDPGAAHPRRPGFGQWSMFEGRKMFAFLDRSGGLVVKLPPQRVDRLIAEKVGVRWDPGNGMHLKEFLAVDISKARRWPALARRGPYLHRRQMRDRDSTSPIRWVEGRRRDGFGLDRSLVRPRGRSER